MAEEVDIFGEEEIRPSDFTYQTETSPHRTSSPAHGLHNSAAIFDDSPQPSGFATPTPCRYPIPNHRPSDLFDLSYMVRAEFAAVHRRAKAKQMLEEQLSVVERTKRTLSFMKDLNLDLDIFIATCSGLPYHNAIDDTMLEEEYESLVLRSTTLLGFDVPEIEYTFKNLVSSPHLHTILLQWHQPSRKRRTEQRFEENRMVEAASLECMRRVLSREAESTLAEALKGLDAHEEGMDDSAELWKKAVEHLKKLRVEAMAARVRQAGPTTWVLISTIVNPDAVEHRQKNFVSTIDHC
jgi:hypothetical protein